MRKAKGLFIEKEIFMERDNLTHGARTAMNHDMDIREWCENYLKEKERANHTEMNEKGKVKSKSLKSPKVTNKIA